MHRGIVGEGRQQPRPVDPEDPGPGSSPAPAKRGCPSPARSKACHTLGSSPLVATALASGVVDTKPGRRL
eukprot:9774039-Lingulodinium_polyedra.AAC.1